VGGMKILRWLVEEAKAIASVTLYFAACFVVIMFLKQLWLAEYGIEFSGIATALVAALVTAKVVIILEHAPLTKWLQGSPGIIEVITRSAVYTFAVLLVMIVEKAFEARTEHGSLMMSLANVFDHPDMPKLWATTICIGLSFLAYNAFAVVMRAMGRKQMVELFLSKNAAVV
jgi:hypothetical protein